MTHSCKGIDGSCINFHLTDIGGTKCGTTVPKQLAAIRHQTKATRTPFFPRHPWTLDHLFTKFYSAIVVPHNSPQVMSISSHEAVPDGSFRHADVSLAQQLLGLLAVWDEPRQQKEYKSR